jgi:septal ring factor EnvC (AmiA/AmiB activator)
MTSERQIVPKEFTTLVMRIQTVTRYLSMIGAALALGAIIFSGIQLHQIGSRINKAETKLSVMETQVKEIDAETQRKEKELANIQAELAFAQASYQRIADKLPKGAAQDAILKTAMADSQSAHLTPIIYIQIARENQRSVAIQIQGKLIALGCQVPTIEYVGVRAPQHSQLRYFVQTDRGPAMQKILSQLRSNGLDINEQYIKIASDRPQALRPNQFELWLGQDFMP